MDSLLFILFFIVILRFIYLYLERGEERETEREGTIDVREKHRVAASHMCPTRDRTHNPGICPDWEPATLRLAAQGPSS